MAQKNDLASYFFHQGTNFRAYEYLGCTLKRLFGKYVYIFRTWAPNASSVSLVSDFTDWQMGLAMKNDGYGVWEVKITSDKPFECSAYKFRIENNGVVLYKGDPYARFSKTGADGASLIFSSSEYTWGDGAWKKYRKKIAREKSGGAFSFPMNIYEVHLGSFLRHDDGTFLSYREAAETLVPYVKSLGYTHVEFLPLAEYPFDGSWGYQVCAFYAPTSRFGNPDDFRYLIDAFHKCGIGVIMDWVPAHFPKDSWGLYEYDGEALYEYQGKDRIESQTWGTRFFDLGREEVQSFLISNALYWLKEFHVDGLRVDAVASMLYLDYDKAPGEWIPNAYGNNINLEAVAFFKKLNSAIRSEFPDALMIAEESGSYGGITASVENSGLGFDLKWNMGWANDFYEYLSTDPVFRSEKHKALNFPIMYAFFEKYCLPISHDEVVHGKKSFIDKIYGSYEDKFLQARTAMLLMMSYPGKKLLFMGSEYAQFREWNFDDSLEWFMTEYPSHSNFRSYVAALNNFYLENKELWELDFTPEGFEWIYPDESDKNAVAYKRKAKDGSELIFLLSFSGSEQILPLSVSKDKHIECVFSSVPDVGYSFDGVGVKLAPYSGVVLREIDNDIKIKI